MPHKLPLSALQHYMYCPRQCALIHVEKAWAENRFTAEGRLMHHRADSGVSDRRDGISLDRSVPVCSEKLMIYGVADVVEMRTDDNGCKVPYPVEYKRGSPKLEDWDRAQLCAQAMCLEEMLSLIIDNGAIFYGKPRRREKVIFDDKLRATVVTTCAEMHEMISRAAIPVARKSPRCRGCSLIGICMPDSLQNKVESYLLKGLGQ